jgi:hypothetical protein
MLLDPTPAQAWHEVGHQSVALIAYRQLSATDQKKVQDILKKHPHFDIFLSPKITGVPVDAIPDEWVVMQAAIWPDWVRNPRSAGSAAAKIKSEFSHPDWHFVNLAITDFDGADDETKMQIITNSKKGKGEALQRLPELLKGLNTNMDLSGVVSSGTSTVDADGARAIALCWVLHLVGDIHQPLHAAALFSKDSLTGDAGGNGFIIRWENRVTDLHSIWDGGFGWDDLKGTHGSQYAAVDGLTRGLLTRNKPTQADRDTLKIQTWAEESLELAKTKAYFPNGKLLPGMFVGFHEHKPHLADLDKMPDGYGNIVTKTAEQRVTLAGFRLAAVLKDFGAAN